MVLVEIVVNYIYYFFAIFIFFFCVFVFFFKQKTAYEIYQCDWSSDVCSSDLMQEFSSAILCVLCGEILFRAIDRLANVVQSAELLRNAP